MHVNILRQNGVTSYKIYSAYASENSKDAKHFPVDCRQFSGNRL